jgi:hypothetical protein
MDLADLKPLCYSAASKLFADSNGTVAGVGVGVVKHEPGVSGPLGGDGHHVLHPTTYHHSYHGYDPGTLATLHHS